MAFQVSASVDLISVYDRLVDLFKRKRKNNLKLFNNYITPIFDDISEIHAKYLKDFREYHEVLMKTQKNSSIKKLLVQVKTDRLYSLEKFSLVYSKVHETSNEKLRNFAFAVHRYFTLGNDDPRRRYSNIFRGDFIEMIEKYLKIDDNQDITTLTDYLELAVENLQNLFADIQNEYTKLQIELTDSVQ